MRALEPDVLATALQAANRALEEGVDVVALPGRSLTPVRDKGLLRLLLILPPDPDPDRFHRWLQVLRDGG